MHGYTHAPQTLLGRLLWNVCKTRVICLVTLLLVRQSSAEVSCGAQDGDADSSRARSWCGRGAQAWQGPPALRVTRRRCGSALPPELCPCPDCPDCPGRALPLPAANMASAASPPLGGPGRVRERGQGGAGDVARPGPSCPAVTRRGPGRLRERPR